MEIMRFTSYLEVLTWKLEQNSTERGYKTRLASAAGCKLSYLSQVLKGIAQLTPEHALALCDFWNLQLHERDYFLNLVHRDRAGTASLKKHYSNVLNDLRRRHTKLSSHLEPSAASNVETERLQTYYRAWQISAVHIALSVPELQTITALARRLRIPISSVEAALGVLQKLGIVEHARGHWRLTKKNLHVSDNPDLSTLNHINWRQRGIMQLQERPSEGLHYTAVSSISRADIERVREVLVSAIKSTRSIIGPSKEEEIVSLLVDFDIL